MDKFIKIWMVAALSAVCFQTAHGADAKLINDSLVKDLSCRNLSVDSIYSAVYPRTAFHTYYHLPVQNWYFKSGGPALGVCWGLASAQRKMFYLARFDEKEELSKDELMRRTLNMVRGHDLSPQQVGEGNVRMVKSPLNRYEVLKYADDSLLSSWMGEKQYPTGIFPLINNGYKEEVRGKSYWKTFKLDVERAQQERFFRFSNLSMVVGDEDDRGTVENMLTFSVLKKNLETHRLTLLNLRFGRMDQHVVVAKDFKVVDNKVAIFVYDSNQPLTENVIWYDMEKKSFHSPGIYQGVKSEGDPKRAIGVYIMDEEERGPIEAAMLRHYQKECTK
ncbi:hypothetical protein [Bdellovibrio sp. HCB288]|uniref:hypothetical protein n=1 Tax=Bdellovibrio sp. HCB288 TaxID=3394355 RepID=UPI0039B56036